MPEKDIHIPERAGHITPFLVMDLLEEAKKMEALGEDVVHLEVGEPDFETPACITEAGIMALKEGKTGYTPSAGLPELKEAIAGRYHQKYGVRISPDRVIVTSGSSPALQVIFAVLVEPGDEVVLTNPHYACYANFIKFFGGKPLFVATDEKDNFRFGADHISAVMSKKTKAVLVNSPANPTGVLLSAQELKEIASLGLTVVSDEIYHDLVYEGKEHSMLEFSNDAFVVDGFSKRYAMTGWRLGYAVVPDAYLRPIQKLVQNFYISAPTMSQWGGLAALREGEKDLVRMKAAYSRRRETLLLGLERIGLKVASRPAGAFYVFVNMKKYTSDSLSFAYDLLKKKRVAVTPGIDFGEAGEGFIRLSYATSVERIEEGLRRIDRYLREL